MNLSNTSNIDYLQIDLNAKNGMTLKALEVLNNVMNRYKFATVTFAHDFFRRDKTGTREKSREIFRIRGYVLLFPNVKFQGNSFEDWYVHPDLVDAELIKKLKTEESLEYTEIENRLRH